eukprot:2113625-Amphidinium_carterae.1
MLGEELGADALAVEEARKRIHATLDAGEDPLTPNADREGHDVIERLHLRPAAKASRETPEERLLDTEPPQGTRFSQTLTPGCTGYNDSTRFPTPRDGMLGCTSGTPLRRKPRLAEHQQRPRYRPGKQ